MTSITAQGEWRDFSFLDADLEVAYNILHKIVEDGDTLLNVTLLTKHSCLPLPLEALKETPFSNPIYQLRQQWEELLIYPVSGSLAQNKYTPQYHWLQKYVHELEECLCRFETVMVTSRQEYE